MDEITKYQAALPFYNAAKQAIAKAHSVDEVLNIKDRAEQLRVAALQANDDELVSKAVEIKLRAKQRTVEMVQEGQKKGDVRKAGGHHCQGIPTMKEVGLDRRQLNDWKPLAQVTERELEKTCEVVKKRDGVVTEASVKREITLREKAEQEELARTVRIAERKKQQGNYRIPKPPISIQKKKEIALRIANAGYRELMKKIHPDHGGTNEEASQLSQVMTWLRRTIEVC